MERRKFLVTMGSIGVAGLAGCTYNAKTNSFRIESHPVRIPSFLFDQTFINNHTVQKNSVQETIQYRGEEKQVNVGRWITRMSNNSPNKLTEATFYTQPDKKIGEQEIDSINVDDPQQVKNVIGSNWNNLRLEQQVDSYSFDVLGDSTDLIEFNGMFKDKEDERARVLYSSFKNEGDDIAFIACIPDNDAYQNDVFSLFQAANHPTDRVEE